MFRQKDRIQNIKRKLKRRIIIKNARFSKRCICL